MQPTRVAALGAQVDEPVARADHVQVVLNDDERVACVDQLAQRTHELGDVVKMQTGGGLVEQKQRAFASARSSGGWIWTRCVLPRPGKPASFKPLGLARR